MRRYLVFMLCVLLAPPKWRIVRSRMLESSAILKVHLVHTLGFKTRDFEKIVLYISVSKIKQN